MAVHEQRIDAAAVEAERLVVDAAVVRRPRAAGWPAVRLRTVVDDAQTRITVLGARRTGNAVGGVGLGPAPGVAERRARREQIDADRIGVLLRVEGFAAADVFRDGDRLRQAVGDVARRATAQAQAAGRTLAARRQADELAGGRVEDVDVGVGDRHVIAIGVAEAVHAGR